MSGSRRARIALPAVMQRPQPQPFPLLASVAPVVMSLVLFLVTRSPFALVFAALGPLVAVATVVDGRLQGRRRWRTERRRFEQELEAALTAVARAHADERADIDLASPSAVERLRRGPSTWWSAAASDVRVTLGRGRRPSSLDLDPPAVHGEEEAGLARLASAAATIDDAAVDVVARTGIGIVGPSPLAAAVARGIVLQLAMQLPPAGVDLVLEAEPPAGHWLRLLPHRLRIEERRQRGVVAFRSRADGAECAVAVAPSAEALAIATGAIVEVSRRAMLLRHPERSAVGPIQPELLSREQAREWAADLAERAQSDGASSPAVPDAVALDAVLSRRDADRRSLAVAIGADGGGAVEVDLVRDGPHAIVGGTTGSGKSELLVSWVLGLAWRYPPSVVTFLLVDFKGGASFAPLEALPHCVGVISDLDEAGALRALASLRAEVRHRERTLAVARVRSIEQLPEADALPRLVIVVDEFAAMVADFPELHTLFADLASRGRSLGLHLVLCTQRPSGAVRDAVLANAGLRISLRVNNRADSQAVIGTAEAAGLPADPVGRALLSASGAPPRLVQVPLATDDDARRTAARHPLDVAPRRPWLDPLPARIPLAALPTVAEGIAFGLLDHPHEQSQPPAVWLPAAHGHLLAIGAGGSGTSTLLRTLGAASADAMLIGSDVEAAWDEVQRRLRAVRCVSGAGSGSGAGSASRAGSGLLLVDDLDELVARLDDEHAPAFVEALCALLREGRRVGLHVALSCQRMLPALHAVASLCDSRVLLRTSSRQDHVLAGGDGALWAERAAPGAGTWRGQRLQVAIADGTLPTPIAELEELRPAPGSTLAVVSGAPRAMLERLAGLGVSVTRVEADPGDPGALDVRAGAAPVAIVGDPEAWQSRWGALPALAATTPVFFHGCAPAEYRALTRSRTLPPPIVGSTDAGHLLRPDGSVTRARLITPPF